MEVMGVRLETIELRGSDDLPLRVDLRHDPDRPSRGKVVVCHGFKGFRRWGFFPWVGERLASAGWLSAVPDFSMNGIGADPVEFGRLDLFEQNTYTRELEDLDQVLADVNERAPGPTGLLGHSRASVDVVVRASEDAGIGAVVTWNGVGKPLRFTDRQLGDWERDGRLEFTNARTGQKMGMSFDFVRDVRKNPGRFDLAVAATRMRAPHLIVHASADMAVPVEESIELAAGRTSGCRRVEIEGSTHTFGAVHPFEGSTPALERAMDLTLEWFSEHLQ
jgi:dienelactone hydrolase